MKSHRSFFGKWQTNLWDFVDFLVFAYLLSKTGFFVALPFPRIDLCGYLPQLLNFKTLARLFKAQKLSQIASNFQSMLCIRIQIQELGGSGSVFRKWIWIQTGKYRLN